MNRQRDAARSILEDPWFRERFSLLTSEERKRLIDEVEKSVRNSGPETTRWNLERAREITEAQQRQGVVLFQPHIGTVVFAALTSASTEEMEGKLRASGRLPGSDAPTGQAPREQPVISLDDDDPALSPFEMRSPRPR